MVLIDLNPRIKLLRPEPKAFFPYSNSLFIDDEIRTVIDAGAGVTNYNSLPPESIGLVLLSHYHFDHTHGVGLFPGAAVQAGVEETPLYNDPVLFEQCTGFSHWYKLMGEEAVERLGATITWPPDVLARPGYRHIDLAGSFQDGTVISLGKTKIVTVHTPGHTLGHYSFWLENEGILFSSDIDLSPGGPWYGDGSSDLDDLVESVEKLIKLQPAILVSSHRRVFDAKKDNIALRLRQYLDVVLKREEGIVSFLSQPRSIDDIAEAGLVYERQPQSSNITFWNKLMICKHLKRLERQGWVQRVDENHYVRQGA